MSVRHSFTSSQLAPSAFRAKRLKTALRNPHCQTYKEGSICTDLSLQDTGATHAQCTLYIVHCTLYSVQCTLYSVHCTVYSVHCTLYIVHCTGEVTWIWLSQMYSITIQTQYVYCTFDIVQGGEVTWRRHSQSRPPCLRPLTERLHTTQCLSYWELQCTQTSLCCIFTARLLPYISTPLLQCTQVYLPHSARICTSVHPVYTCRILQGEACVRAYGLLRTAVGATRHAPYITLYIL